MVKVAQAQNAAHADYWIRLKAPRRPAVQIPVHAHRYFRARKGSLCPVVQLVVDAHDVGIRLVTDVTDAFAASREAYTPRTEHLALDFGLSTLLATNRGDLFGRGLLADLIRIDRQLTSIARHRTRSGQKPRDSKRYCRLVTRLRGMLRTRVNAALNRAVQAHVPAEITVESLSFRHPKLSRRMNRLVTNCGRAVFQDKLRDLEDKFGIVSTEINPAYTSQECSRCGYVDRRNRTSQSNFSCRWCGSEVHADVDAARVIKARRSCSLGTTPLRKGEILRVLVDRHVERWPSMRGAGCQGTASDPRLTNRYFNEWTASVTKLYQHCALMQ
jgi:putative transposase